MIIKNYAQAEAFLAQHTNYEKLLGGSVAYNTKTFDLDSFRALLVSLGSPQLRYSAIHVAGTKGKGSTCAIVAAALTGCGCRTGRYTSPHLNSYLERIAIDGKSIPEQDFCRILGSLGEHFATQERAADVGFRTVFELLTATAFTWFAENNVEVAVIETGLGGRLDSTNSFVHPPQAKNGFLIDVITAIGLEHTSVLGDTIEKIAREKLGIVQPHAGAVVIAPQPEGYSECIETIARKVATKTPVHANRIVSADRLQGTWCMVHLLPGTDYDDALPLAASLLRGMEVDLPLLGAHQLRNLETALTTLLEVERLGGYPITPGGVAAGIARVDWPGRFEIVSRDPLAVVDGAHCPLSAEALGRTFRELFGDREAVVVAGFMRDKAVDEICEALGGLIRVVGGVCCAPESARAMEAERAAATVSKVFKVPVKAEPEVADALRTALQIRKGSQAILVFGSMFLVAPARAALKELLHRA